MTGPQHRAGRLPFAEDIKRAQPTNAYHITVCRVAGDENGRVDSWIWSVRLTRTRSAASSACRAGHVRVNGVRVKPAHAVRAGDEVRLHYEGRDRVVVVQRVITKRAGASVAATKWEKRNIALEIPVWDEELCIQCGKCVMVCPHAVIRAKVYDAGSFNHAPAAFQTAVPKWREFCRAEVHAASGARRLHRLRAVRRGLPGQEQERSQAPRHQHGSRSRRCARSTTQYWDYFLSIPELSREKLSHGQVKDVQLLQPLFEFSGACSGCGETPYISS